MDTLLPVISDTTLGETPLSPHIVMKVLIEIWDVSVIHFGIKEYCLLPDLIETTSTEALMPTISPTSFMYLLNFCSEILGRL